MNPPAQTTGAGQLQYETLASPSPTVQIGYTYDALGRTLGRAITVQGALTGQNNASSVVYDALGRVYSATNPLAKARTRALPRSPPNAAKRFRRHYASSSSCPSQRQTLDEAVQSMAM